MLLVPEDTNGKAKKDIRSGKACGSAASPAGLRQEPAAAALERVGRGGRPVSSPGIKVTNMCGCHLPWAHPGKTADGTRGAPPGGPKAGGQSGKKPEVQGEAGGSHPLKKDELESPQEEKACPPDGLEGESSPVATGRTRG